MMFKAATFLAFAASEVFAHPYADPEPILNNRDTSKQLCTTLELPTEEQYKIGYKTFCSTYVSGSRFLGWVDEPIVATVMLKTHIGTTIPWVFKVSVFQACGNNGGDLQRSMCISGFKDYLEGERAKLGTNYCVVDGTGGNGASRGYSGQGNVLILPNTMAFNGKQYVNNGFVYETRRRNGDFDPNQAVGK